jgi:hypothetical protein
MTTFALLFSSYFVQEEIVLCRFFGPAKYSVNATWGGSGETLGCSVDPTSLTAEAINYKMKCLGKALPCVEFVRVPSFEQLLDIKLSLSRG